MNRESRWAVVPALCLAALGCSGRVPLSEGLVKQLPPEDFKNLQCYVSDTVVLRRVLKSEEKAVTRNHVLKVEKDRRIEEVYIRADTPGVVVGTRGDKLLVSFEPPVDGVELTLAFAVHFRDGLTAYFFEPDQLGEGFDRVAYGGKLYSSDGANRGCHLEIEQDKDRDVHYKSRDLPGRRIEDEPKK